MKTGRLITCILVGVAVSITPIVGAHAAQTIKLTFGTPFPKAHPNTVADLNWMEKIKKGTNGRVLITPYWAGALVSVKEAFAEISRGVADIGSCSLSYSPAGFDLSVKEQLFYYGVPSIEIQRRVYREVRSKFPTDAKLGEVKVLANATMPPYHALTNKPARRLEDFKGLSLKALRHLIGPIKELGGEGVSMSMFDVYVALEKGTIDGLFGPYEALKSLRLGEVVDYCTALNIANGPSAQRIMNLNSWNRLPPDIQKVFEDNIEWWGYEIQKSLENADQAGIEFGKEQGVEFIELSPEDLKKFYSLLEAVALKDAAELDAKGLPGTKIFSETRRLIELYSK